MINSKKSHREIEIESYKVTYPIDLEVHKKEKHKYKRWNRFYF